MNSIVGWFARNSVVANMLMIVLIVAGALAIPKTQKEILPAIEWNYLTIQVAYPGASQTEVERSIVAPIEDAIFDIDGVDRIYSKSSDNVGFIFVETDYKTAAQKIRNDIETRLSSKVTLPSNARPPKIEQLSIRDPVADIVIHGNADERVLKTLAQQIRDDLLETHEVTQIELSGETKREISIDVDQLALMRYGISVIQIVESIRRQSQTIASGELKDNTGSSMVLTRPEGAISRDWLEDLVVRSDADGGRLRVRDVAKVNESDIEEANQTRFNNEPAVYLSIYRGGNQNILDVAEAVREYVKNPKVLLPEGIEVTTWRDSSKFFEARINLLVSNAVSSMILVFLVLWFFMGTRLAFWVSSGIPIAFMGALASLPYLGISINMVSLFAFILVMGVVVDDAIIISENIHTYQKSGKYSFVEAAERGVKEVGTPIIYACWTTVLMFVPLGFLPGPEGQIMYVLPIVAASILFFSLIETMLILPAHLASPHNPLSMGKKIDGALSKWRLRCMNALSNFFAPKFQWLLTTTLRNRYITHTTFIGIFLITLGLIQGGWIKTRLLTEIESDLLTSEITFPNGTSPKVTGKALARIEAGAIELRDKIEAEFGKPVVRSIIARAGRTADQDGPHMGSVTIELFPDNDRKVTGAELVRQWREKAGGIPGASKLVFNSTLNKVGPAINLRLTSPSFDDLSAASAQIKKRLSQFSGVSEVRDSFEEGNQEIILKPKASAADLGLNMDQIAAQVRQLFHGIEATEFQREYENVKVVVRHPNFEDGSLWQLENMSLLTPAGSMVPLHTVADLEYGSSPAVVERFDRKRSLEITAYVDQDFNSTDQIMIELKKDVLNSLSDKYKSVDWFIDGAQRVQTEFIQTLLSSYLLALICMYAIMAILYKSYVMPLVIMYAIPFGMIGALFGHLVMGLDVTLWSLIGICAVSGVVVNDSLVLVDRINDLRAEDSKGNIFSIVEEGTLSRVRAVMLTTITTTLGLLPSVFQQSVQSQFLVPMAV
ncbi:MAG: efflux RND transporter permease subunit, partial [Pseudomonadota bacterium]